MPLAYAYAYGGNGALDAAGRTARSRLTAQAGRAYADRVAEGDRAPPGLAYSGPSGRPGGGAQSSG